MEQKAFDELLKKIEEYVDLTPAKLAREYCRRVVPETNPALIRQGFSKGYLVAELLREEYGAAGRLAPDDQVR